MFDNNTKQAWQSIQPDPGLKDRALKQTPKKVTPFPPNLIKTAAAVAACLIVAVHVLGLGQSLVEVDGRPVDRPMVLQNAGTLSREVTPLSSEEGITVELTVAEGCVLTVSDGSLEGNRWTVEAPGDYLLRAVLEGKTQYFRLSYDQDSGLWSLRPED